jgi:hypothetical protein
MKSERIRAGSTLKIAIALNLLIIFCIKGSIFPGLWLPVFALLAGNRIEVLNGLQAGLAASEHQAFIQKLAERGSP